MTLRSTGVGRVHTGEADLTIIPSTWAGGGPVVLVCHGAGGSPATYFLSAARRDLDLLADTGCCVVVAELGGTSTWANDTVLSRITEARTYAGETWGADVDRTVLIGDSMGAMSALIWAVNNPGLWACVAGRIPVVAADALHDRQPTGLGLLIDAAYGGAAAWETAKADRDPSAAGPAAAIAAVADRVRLWYSTNDPIVLPSDITTFTAATGVQARPLGDIGHDQATLGPAIDAHAQARWIWSYL